MTITADMTFNKPLPRDYGLEIQAKARSKLDEMKRIALIRPLADQAWADLTPFYRAWLSFCGYTAMSYYEELK